MPSPYSSGPTSYFSLSDSVNINALLSEQLKIWGSGSSAETDVTYSFPWTSRPTAFWDNYYLENFYGPNAEYIFGFNSTQIQAARDAFLAWENVANVNFVEIAESSSSVGDIRLAFSSDVSDELWGFAYLPDRWPEAGDIWVNTSLASDADWSPGTYNYSSLVHEIGHSLGLKHPFEGVINLPTNLDAVNYTVMAYIEPENVYYRDQSQNQTIYTIQNPMVYDILAIQYLYGENTSYRTGDDVYLYDPSQPFYETIWDAGGIDTIDLSLFVTDNVIDLFDGSYSSISFPDWIGSDNLGIAFNTIIENAIGGSGNDTIIGNDVSNALSGGAGDDILRGYEGDDTLIGGSGSDSLYGYFGNDYLDGGAGNDYLKGEGGNDRLYGGSGIDTAFFAGNRTDYSSTNSSSSNQVIVSDLQSGRDGIDTLTNIERLSFLDGTLALDTSGNAGQTYRLYQAAFGRTPDTPGLAHNVNLLDTVISLDDLSNGFIVSAEFLGLYGADSSNSTFITMLYQNVLGRLPDEGGFNAWNFALTSGQLSRADVLIGFSESPENITLVGTAIEDGIWLG